MKLNYAFMAVTLLFLLAIADVLYAILNVLRHPLTVAQLLGAWANQP